MSWLLGRGYADVSSLKLVGDRYNLTSRQRAAVMRCACADGQRDDRMRRRVDTGDAVGETLLLDGYNVLITVESALGGGVLFLARDGCVRDLASIHGTYRKVAETLPAVEIIAQALAGLGVGAVRWLLDRPVSNSGRLKQLLGGYGDDHGLDWTVDLVQNPDTVLIESDALIATSDSGVLDACGGWVNLTRVIVDRLAAGGPLRVVDLSTSI